MPHRPGLPVTAPFDDDDELVIDPQLSHALQPRQLVAGELTDRPCCGLGHAGSSGLMSSTSSMTGSAAPGGTPPVSRWWSGTGRNDCPRRVGRDRSHRSWRPTTENFPDRGRLALPGHRTAGGI